MEKKKLLVVDDEEDICVFIKDIFERKGFEVYTALSGEEAMDVFNKHRPQICLIDIHMPYSEFDGIEVLRRIKDIDKSTICVMVTRIDNAQRIEEATGLGAAQYLIKPVSIKKIEEFMERLKNTAT